MALKAPAIAYRHSPGQDFRGADLADTVLNLGVFVGANFNDANISGITAKFASFAEATMLRVNASNASFIGANFSRANLAGADFSKAVLKLASFRNSNLTGANFDGADLSGTDFTGAVMAGADFEGALNLNGAIFDKELRPVPRNSPVGRKSFCP